VNLALLTVMLAAATAAWGLTGRIRRYAVGSGIVDVPNQRSLHTAPTPRGGGLSIAVVSLLGIGVATLVDLVPTNVGLALVGGGIAIAGVGWLDDARGVSAPARLIVHAMGAVWALYWLGGLPSLDLGVATLRSGVAGAVLAAAGIVWSTNLYNFMDGADGLAATQAVAIGAFGGLLLFAAGAGGLALAALLIAAASAGFLAWNWEPAKIFMGDVGSGLLGFLFAVLAIAGENANAVPILAWALLGGVFIFDATVTLVRRLRRGERWDHGHRHHAYQRIVEAGWTHGRMSATVLMIDVGLALIAGFGATDRRWLLPMAALGAVALSATYYAVERVRPMRAGAHPAADLAG